MRETEVVFPYMRCWPFSSARVGSDIIGGHYGGERVSRRVSTLVQPLHLHQTSSVLLDICTLDTHFILYLHARKRLSFCRIFDNTKFRIFSSNCIDCTLCLYLHCRTFRRHTWAFVQRTPRHVSIAGNLVAVWSGHHHPSLSTTYIFGCKRNFSIFKEMEFWIWYNTCAQTGLLFLFNRDMGCWGRDCTEQLWFSLCKRGRPKEVGSQKNQVTRHSQVEKAGTKGLTRCNGQAKPNLLNNGRGKPSSNSEASKKLKNEFWSHIWQKLPQLVNTHNKLTWEQSMWQQSSLV